MPDLQSELSKIAHAWDSHEQTIRQPQQEKVMKATPISITGNASKDTFNLIRDNPYGYTHTTAAKKMVALGYKLNSVHSLITQMKRAGIFIVDAAGGTLYTQQGEYKPFSNPYKAKPAGRLKPRAKPTKTTTAEGIAALQVVDTPVKEIPTQWDAETVLAHIGVKEAFKLYEVLHKMFGGAK